MIRNSHYFFFEGLYFTKNFVAMNNINIKNKDSKISQGRGKKCDFFFLKKNSYFVSIGKSKLIHISKLISS